MCKRAYTRVTSLRKHRETSHKDELENQPEKMKVIPARIKKN